MTGTYAWVNEAFSRLRPLPGFYASGVVPGVVGQNSPIYHTSFLVSEPSHLGRGPEQQKTQEPRHDGQAAEEIRHVPPRLKTGAARLLERADPIHGQLRDNSEAGVGALKDEGARSVLACRVPRADDEDEARADAALEHALEGAEGDQVGEILGKANAEDHDAPAEHADGEDQSHPVPLEDDVGRKLEAHVGDVEDGGEPIVLLTDQVGVVS